jgi:hypothetical protein
MPRGIIIVGTRQEDDSRRGAEAQRMTEDEIGTIVIEAAIAVRCVNGLEE